MKTISEWNETKVLITGGAGFIGHNIALKFSSLGAKVHVIDSLQVNSLGHYTNEYAFNENAETYIGFVNERLSLMRRSGIGLSVVDLRDYSAVCREVDLIEPDVVVHLAAVAHANRSNKDPYSTFDHSLRTLENVLDASRKTKPHFVYFSSSMVYGNFESASVAEDAVCNPIGIYGALKYAGEKIVISYGQVFDLPYTIVRPSALYGERCVSRRVGQAFIENALRNKDLTVNGDGSDALDFTYIADLVQGVQKVVETEASKGELFNITYGASRTIKELADIVLERFPNIKLKFNPKDSLMPERGTLEIDKAKSILGYEPAYALDQGFSSYIDWYVNFNDENPDLFR